MDTESPEICTILLVDDVVDNLTMLQVIFESEGYTVELAENASIALKKLEAFQPDLILSDVMMPGITGDELTRLIRQNEKWQSIPVVLITAYPQENAQGLLKSGANDLIFKPFDFNDLVERITSLLAEARGC